MAAGWKWPLHLALVALVCLFLAGLQPAFAQEYSFSLNQRDFTVTVNEDGSADLDYRLVFTCQPSAHPIDIVDVGMPQKNYSLSQVSAKAGDGTPLTDIRPSEVVKPGVEVHLDSHTILPGKSGTLLVHARVPRMVYGDTSDPLYASIVIAPTWYDSKYVHGTTKSKVSLVFPAGVQPDEARYHETAFTSASVQNNRVVYQWTGEVQPDKMYQYGASFPRKYVSYVVPPPWYTRTWVWVILVAIPLSFIVVMIWLSAKGYHKAQHLIWAVVKAVLVFGLILGAAILVLVGGNAGLLWVVIFGAIWLVQAVYGGKRKLEYLPPAMKIEGLGTRQGLMAPEAAVLMGKPLDKVLCLILFGLIRKGSVKVISDKPLKLEKLDRPAGAEPLQVYETDFLRAIKPDASVAEGDIKDMMVAMVKSVNGKMKGFSYKDTVNYYQHITDEAWRMVEAGNTPQVKVQTVEDKGDWMLFDEDYPRRFHGAFSQGYYPVPRWYVPYAATSAAPGPAPGGGGKGFTVPELPGAQFASGFVTWTQNFSSQVVHDITGLSAKVTAVTNPVPVSSGSSYHGGGGGGCACACACAGCACACAGGGR